MGFINKLFRWNKKAENPTKDIADYMSSTYIHADRDGVSFACLDKIANSIGSISVGVYSTKNKAKAENHYLNELFKFPNLEETKTLFMHQIVLDYYCSGNIFLYKSMGDDGKINSLFRLNPNEVYVSRDLKTNQKLFSYNGKTYTAKSVLHIPSRFQYNGLIGKSIYDVVKSTFDTAQSLDDYTSNSFMNNLGKRLVVDFSNLRKDITEDAEKNLRDKYVKNYGGPANSGKPLIKYDGINFEVVDTGTSDNRASELSENRDYQTRLVAMIFGIPVELLSGDGTNDVEKITTLYLENAIVPLIGQLEEYFEMLLSPEERMKYYIHFNYDTLKKASTQSRIDSFTKEFNNGFLSINEIRQKSDLGPIDGGDNHYRSAQIVPIDMQLDNAIGAESKIKMAGESPETTMKNTIDNIELQQKQNVNEQKNASAVNIGSDKM